MNILLVDDHIMTLEGYAAILNNADTVFTKVQNCEEAYHKIVSSGNFDVAIFDYSIPAYPEQKLHSGVDCAVLLRKYHPDCRIILITAYSEGFELYSIKKKAKPDALIVKEDLTIQSFKEIVFSKELAPNYLSRRAKEAIALVKKQEVLMNDVNIEILMYLSRGYKPGQLSEIIGLSKSGVQKRLSKMQEDFDVPDTSALIKLMYELEYI